VHEPRAILPGLGDARIEIIYEADQVSIVVRATDKPDFRLTLFLPVVFLLSAVESICAAGGFYSNELDSFLARVEAIRRAPLWEVKV